MLPQILTLSDGNFLCAFAKQTYEDPGLHDSQTKSITIRTVLAEAISKASFYKPKPPEPKYPYIRKEPPTPEEDPYIIPKRYLQLCLDTKQNDLVEVIVEKVMDTNKLSVPEVQEHARAIMIPLVTFSTELSSTNPAIRAIQKLDVLRHTALALYTDWLGANPDLFTQAEVAKVLNISMAGIDNNPQIFIEMLVYSARLCSLF